MEHWLYVPFKNTGGGIDDKFGIKRVVLKIIDARNVDTYNLQMPFL